MSAFREAVPVFSGLFGAQVNILHYAFSLFKSTYTVATSKETEHIAHKNQCFKIFFRRDSSLEPLEIQERKEAAAVTSAGKGVFGVHFPGKKNLTQTMLYEVT